MSDFWERTMALQVPAWQEDLQRDYAYAESLRPRATFNTGTINEATGLGLRALCARFTPRLIVEVGTFIGKSTLSLRATHIFTCDCWNDCLPSGPGRSCFPKTMSTAMLKALAGRMLVDLFFFDGRIQPPDLAFILYLSRPRTIYAFDDYRGEEKGTANIRALRPYLRRHELIAPREGTALAVLAPVEA